MQSQGRAGRRALSPVKDKGVMTRLASVLCPSDHWGMPPRRPSRRVSDDQQFLEPSQFDLFPVRPVIELLDARSIVGPRTAVEHLIRVRLRPNDAPHLVFHDRHGWYCEAHGPTCHAVTLAREDVK